MATKVKKGYGPKTNKKVGDNPSDTTNGDDKKSRKDKPIYPDQTVLPAPVWRRLFAYAIDLMLGLGTSALMVFSASVPGTEEMTRIWLLLSGIVMQFWLFGFLPSEYTPGQTLGQKMLRLYVRQVRNKKTLGVWRSMARGYFYGVLGAPLTIPFEVIALIGQFLMEKKAEPKKLQNLPLSQKALTLPRDALFNVEVIYVPKHKVA